MSRSLRVAFVATECTPFVKIGGLGDVIGSLPPALEKHGVGVNVILPFECAESPGGERLASLDVNLGEHTIHTGVHRTLLPGSGVPVFLIRDGHYFPRGGIYLDPSAGREYPDQMERWVFFQRAALALIGRECPDVDVIHCHEHQTGLVPAYLSQPSGTPRRAATVFTIHNLGYQGLFPARKGPLTALPEHMTGPGGALEFYGQLNFMKCGIETADAVTVVSPSYAGEIQTEEFGCGLHGVIAGRKTDLFGILNGIDEIEWNPAADRHIAARYSASAREGKRTNRRALLETFGLAAEKGHEPVLGMVSRIDTHKGFDLVLGVLDRLLSRGSRFTLAGTGDPALERSLRDIGNRYPQRAGLRFAFDNRVAHQIVAGADILLMPSKYEPCGLTQMYAMRYGTVPVVRATGGLADTVREFDAGSGEGEGFRFRKYDAGDFLRAIERAVEAWRTPAWATIVGNGMNRDFGWSRSAARYIDLYDRLSRK